MPTIKGSVTVLDPIGLHARPAGQIVKLVKDSGLEVRMGKPGEDLVKANSPLRMMAMKAKTGVARLAIMTKTQVVPCAQWGAQAVLSPYGRKISLFPRRTFHVWAGEPLDFSKWYGREDDPVAIREATDYAMDALTALLEQIRGESAPATRFDPSSSDHPRIGNYKKRIKKNRKSRGA